MLGTVDADGMPQGTMWICLPGEVMRIRAQFKTAGQYAWHCHIVDHEDNEMMRPYRIGRKQLGQP